jgi:FolB domain-containing protein
VSDVIELRGLRFSCIVGVLDHERVNEQPISLDIDIKRSFKRAVKGDDVLETTNYADILRLAKDVAVIGKFQLLETLADRVAKAILAYDDAITSVRVSVQKLEPPVGEDVSSVGVRTRRRRV